MSSGLVTFALGDREYATRLSSVREVVRLEGLADLPGMTPPLAGVLDLRGTALPVLDLRFGDPAHRGDVLVLENPDETLVGVAVDKVRAVVDDAELSPGGAASDELPAYVVEVLRGAHGPVFLVDLPRMVEAARRVAP
ncbi:MAG: CheW protein [Frankiales bacterium]|nr:CheW protein [Frankiales bacterium]